MLEKEFIAYEQALALKELGFDEPCFKLWQNENTVTGTYGKSKNWILTEHKFSSNYFYNNSFTHPKAKGICSAPLYQQAFRWFREKYGLCSWITMELGNKSTFCWVLSGEHTSTQYAAYFHTYEEAELTCLKKLIEIVKNK
jgi:hypothetical protein